MGVNDIVPPFAISVQWALGCGQLDHIRDRIAILDGSLGR